MEQVREIKDVVLEQMDVEELPEIPSEFIEPYLVRMLSTQFELLAFQCTEEKLIETKQNLKGVERFVSYFGGIHSRLAVSNVYSGFYNMSLEDVKKLLFK